MKKFSREYQYPLMASMVLPIMLLGMPAIMAYQTLPADQAFLAAWTDMLTRIVPPVLGMLAVVAPSVRFFVTRVLLEPAHDQANS